MILKPYLWANRAVGLATWFQTALTPLFFERKSWILMKLLKVVVMRMDLLLHGFTRGVSINWIGKSNNAVFPDSKTFLQKTWPDSVISKLQKEGLEVYILESSAELNTVKPVNFNSESGLCILLYSLILLNNFTKVIETGVANGVSTRVIMRALEQTGGTLHSFDISENCQNTYKGDGNWLFYKLETGRFIKKRFRELVNQIGKCQLWLHDSNHSQLWQEFEYALAWENLEDNGVLCSDDVDASPAWGLASREYLNKSSVIFDSRKFIGIAFKSNTKIV